MKWKHKPVFRTIKIESGEKPTSIADAFDLALEVHAFNHGEIDLSKKYRFLRKRDLFNAQHPGASQ